MAPPFTPSQVLSAQQQVYSPYFNILQAVAFSGSTFGAAVNVTATITVGVQPGENWVGVDVMTPAGAALRGKSLELVFTRKTGGTLLTLPFDIDLQGASTNFVPLTGIFPYFPTLAQGDVNFTAPPKPFPLIFWYSNGLGTVQSANIRKPFRLNVDCDAVTFNFSANYEWTGGTSQFDQLGISLAAFSL
jgi:hypothetical protein